MVGTSALRSAWRRMTTFSGSPLARAAVTYCDCMVSIIEERVRRETCATSPDTSVATGRMMCCSHVQKPSDSAA